MHAPIYHTSVHPSHMPASIIHLLIHPTCIIPRASPHSSYMSYMPPYYIHAPIYHTCPNPSCLCASCIHARVHHTCPHPSYIVWHAPIYHTCVHPSYMPPSSMPCGTHALIHHVCVHQSYMPASITHARIHHTCAHTSCMPPYYIHAPIFHTSPNPSYMPIHHTCPYILQVQVQVQSKVQFFLICCKGGRWGVLGAYMGKTDSCCDFPCNWELIGGQTQLPDIH